MSDNPVLLAEERTEFGKGAARRARRAAKVPTVLYGHGAEPRHLDVPEHDLFLIVRGTKNALVELKIAGKTQLAHTLNNTCVAPPRMLIALLENNLQADGSVKIPKVLQPYMGGKEVLIPRK